MSVLVFYYNFKFVISILLLQYLKNYCLYKVWMMIIYDGMKVSVVVMCVGYESVL